MGKKILVGISGGVDSAVSALLLLKAGYEVTGCRLLLSENSENSEDSHSAEDVADRLGIKLITADFRKEFNENVSRFFVDEYLHGRTPNPCIKCNPTVKFSSLIKVADELGIANIATGHYARIDKDKDTGLYAIKTSPSKKDQSYFLYRLPQEILRRTLFPLGKFETKDEIRKTGSEAGFEAAEKKDSQEICFIPDNDYIGYIYKVTGKKSPEGNFIDTDGKIIGRHSGIANYTVGQRKGLGAFGEPRYVKALNPEKNTVTLCKAEERFSSAAKINNVFWTYGFTPDLSKEYGVKIRSTAKATPAKLFEDSGKIRIEFSSPVLAPCPGQSAVIYDKDIILGGGEIE